MKYLPLALLILMFISGPSIQAQDTEMVETYCMIVGTKKFMSNKVKVQLDFGQGINLWKPRQSMLKDSNGKPLSFGSMVDALNHMALQGWVFVDAYAISNENQNLYHWIMKKTVPASEIE